MPIAPDDWLSERLGRPVFSVSPEALGEVERQAGAMYQARVPTDDVAAVRAFSAAGFYVVDAALKVARAPGRLDGSGDWRVGEAQPEHVEALASIAARGFRHDRFHLDPAIPDAVADRIKHDWVANAAAGGRGDGVLAALRDGEPAGFLILLDRGDERIVDLMGVDPERRGEGAGHTLLARFVSDAAGFAAVSAGTQAANVAATRMYEAAGFTLVGSAYNMHLHT